MKTLIFALIVAGNLISDTARAITPEVALQMAFENSPLIQKSEAQKQEVSWKKVEGFSVLLPTVKFSANHFFEKKYEYLDMVMGGSLTSLPQIFPASSATLEAKWLLFDGLANVNTYRASRANMNAAEAEDAWVKFQLDREVNLAYTKVVAAKKLSEVAEQNLKTLENHLDQVKNLKKGGFATNYDVLRVEAQLSEAQAELLQTKDNIQIAQEKLALILGTSSAIDTESAELAVPNVENVINLNFNGLKNRRLDLQAMQARVDASELMDDAKSMFWIPKIGLSGQYIRYNNLNDNLTDFHSYRPAWNVGLFLTWELFNMRDVAQAKQEKFKAIQSEKFLQQANLQAPVDFAFWKKRYLYSATLYKAKKADLDRGLETARLADAGFKAGVRTTTEVLDAESDLFRARAGIVNAQMNCIEAKIKLELATGEKL